jgi:hypothetical protein
MSANTPGRFANRPFGNYAKAGVGVTEIPVIPGERSEAERGKGSQLFDIETDFDAWLPFPSLSLGRG